MTISIYGWMRRSVQGAGLSLVLAMAPAAALASTVTQTFSYSSGFSNWNVPVTFIGFNNYGTGGVLQSVAVTLTETMSGFDGIDIENNTKSTLSGSASLQNTATLQIASLETVVINTQSTGILNIPGGGESGLITLSGSNSNTSTYTSPSDLAYFLNTYDANASGTHAVLLSFGGADVTFPTPGDYNTLTAEVVYTYNPASPGPPATPVPAAWSNMLIGLVGLGGFGVLRQRRIPGCCT